MKHIFAFFCLSIFIVFPSHADEEKEQSVRDMVNLFQEESVRQTGHEIEVVFPPALSYQAHAKIFETGPVITIYALMVKEFSSLELVTIACHEVGHILGEVREANLPLGGMRTFPEAVEGEADYFAGSCIKRFIEEKFPELDSGELAAKSAANAYQKLLQSRDPLDPDIAREKSIIGVLVGYPQHECRLLSVLNGSMGLERPKCWYNPE